MTFSPPIYALLLYLFVKTFSVPSLRDTLMLGKGETTPKRRCTGLLLCVLPKKDLSSPSCGLGFVSKRSPTHFAYREKSQPNSQAE